MACAGKVRLSTGVVLVWLAWIAACMPVAAAPVSITLRPNAIVAGPQVTLGDVALMRTTDLAALRQLMAMPLGATPSPGAVTRIDRETLERRVAARSGFGAAAAGVLPGRQDLRWSGAQEIEITSATQQISGESVAVAAKEVLARWLSTFSSDVDIQIASTVRDLLLPPGELLLRSRPLSGSPTRRMQVWVEAWVDDRFVRTVAVSFEVSVWATAAVATSTLADGTELDAIVEQAALVRRPVDVAKLSHPLAMADVQEAAAGSHKQRLRRTVHAGEALTAGQVELLPAVTRGRLAQMDVRSGDVRVQSKVEVLQDGRLGEMVRVKVPGGSGPVLAKVTGPGAVEIQP